MTATLSRRAALLAGTAALTATAARSEPPKPKSPFTLCLNTSTVRTAAGKSRDIVELIGIARRAGFRAIEPWVSELDAFVTAGGKPEELKSRFADAGLEVPDAICFAEWIVPDAGRRKAGLERAKRDMDLVQRVGGTRVAAPPVGATKPGDPSIDLLEAADRYRQLWELGRTMGITPLVEVWGFSANLRRLGETLLVAAESGVEGAAVLPDVYHLYKGGSDFAGLSLLSAAAVGIFHVNDYPAIDRGKIGDADRVYPGDGVAPLAGVLRTLGTIGYAGCLSVELFNRTYWKQDPLAVATTAREKLEAVVAAAAK